METRYVLESLANKFFDDFNENKIDHQFDASAYPNHLRSEVCKIARPEDQVIFMRQVLTKNAEAKKKHLLKCSYPGDREKCPETNVHNVIAYFTNQEIEKLTRQSDSDESFSVCEIAQINDALDEVMAKLRELQLGQEVIYSEIDELKSMTHLKKKTFMEVVLGKVVKVAGDKVTDPEVLRWIYERITGSGVPKLLE